MLPEHIFELLLFSTNNAVVVYGSNYNCVCCIKRRGVITTITHKINRVMKLKNVPRPVVLFLRAEEGALFYLDEHGRTRIASQIQLVRIFFSTRIASGCFLDDSSTPICVRSNRLP